MEPLVHLISRIVIDLKNANYDVKSLYWRLVEEEDRDSFVQFCKICLDNKYPFSYVRDIHKKYYERNKEFHEVNFMDLAAEFPCETVFNSDENLEFCKSVLASNPKSVEDYKSGKKGSINHLKGQVAKLSKGKADMVQVAAILEKILNEP